MEGNENVQNGRSQSAVQKRKPSLISALLLVVIGICISTVAFSCIYVLKIKPNISANVSENNGSNATQTEHLGGQTNDSQSVAFGASNYELNLQVGGDIFNLLYSKLPTSRNGSYPLAYAEGKTELSSLTDQQLAYSIVSQMDYEYMTDYSISGKLKYRYQRADNNIEVRKITYSDANSLCLRYYGKSIPEVTCENGAGYVYEFCQEDMCFYGHSYPGGGGSSFKFFRVPTKFEISDDGNELYIYDSFVSMNYTNSSDKGNLYTLYSDNTSNHPIRENVLETYVNGESLYEGMTARQIMESEIYSHGGQYKHTFRKDAYLNYVWVCSEKLN